MTKLKEIQVPDLGGAHDVQIIEIAVKAGDTIKVDDTLITLESEKASLDIPAPEAGVVKEVKVKVGDKVSEGHVILTLETAAESSATELKKEEKTAEPEQATMSKQEIHVPDIGTDHAVKIIEMHVAVGDEIKVDSPLITLESEKAAMDVPSPLAGKVTEVKVKVGDSVKHNDLILIVETAVKAAAPTTEKKTAPAPSAPATKSPARPTEAAPILPQGEVYAGPAVRRLAFQLGVNLAKVAGSGRKGRILPEDIHAHVKKIMQQVNSGQMSGGGLNLLPMPSIDFTKYGEIEAQPLSRIKKISGANLHRNWVMIPHVTQFEEADITDMEAFRQENKADAEKQGAKLTPLVFIMKAVVASLKAYPKFNASLDNAGENLIMKKYFHIGVAVDTPNGLVVPVIRDVDQKGFIQLAKELAELSKKAREGKLTPGEMQGGCFSISSLGGIGGTAFTPIINAPEVAILGVSRSEIKPKFIENEFKPRLMLPLSLSYDHRVIDGADAARFAAHLATELADIRRLLF